MPVASTLNDYANSLNSLHHKVAGGFVASFVGNYHEINYRDKVTMGVMIERLRRKGGLQRTHFGDLPFNVVLDDWG